MPDDSHLDRQYFIDNYVFNCPFCNRRNVSYRVLERVRFDWSDKRKGYAYFAICLSCKKTSLHLSERYVQITSRGAVTIDGVEQYLFEPSFKAERAGDIDAMFIASIPSSFFTLDERIPREVRELFSEAEGCLKGNYLTGASACVRKIIYEMAVREGAEGTDYEARIKSLKTKFPEVESTYFDTLLTIQQATSSKVHENALDGWKAEHLRVMLATLAEILGAIYVLPKEREQKRSAILALRDKLLPKNKGKEEKAP